MKALALISEERTMDSREIAEVTRKRHDHVIRDIEAMLEKINGPKSGAVNESKSGPVKFEASYTDGKGEARKCYKLPYRETMILVSGYSVELRAAVVDRWMELERAEADRQAKYKKLRDKSRAARHNFTDTLKDHGCSKPGHYIQITKSMKSYLGIPETKKKDQLDMMELARTTAAEMVATCNIMRQGSAGYIECKHESDKASRDVFMITSDNNREYLSM